MQMIPGICFFISFKWEAKKQTKNKQTLKKEHIYKRRQSGKTHYTQVNRLQIISFSFD